MKRLLPTLVLMIVALTAGAAEPIEGAFGLKLGDPYSSDKAPAITSEYEIAYEFTPEKPNPAFSKYLVYVSPNTHLIYKIIAQGTAEPAGGDKVVQTLQAIIHRKYDDSTNSGSEVRLGDRSIVISQQRNAQRVISSTGAPAAPSAGPQTYYNVTYLDARLSGMASAEHLKNKQSELLKDADATGL